MLTTIKIHILKIYHILKFITCWSHGMCPSLSGNLTSFQVVPAWPLSSDTRLWPPRRALPTRQMWAPRGQEQCASKTEPNSCYIKDGQCSCRIPRNSSIHQWKTSEIIHGKLQCTTSSRHFCLSQPCASPLGNMCVTGQPSQGQISGNGRR